MKTNELSLNERIKTYEREYELKIKPEKNIIIRIDGHKFSKFTKKFKKPYDDLLSRAMELTTIDLVQEFNAVTGYTQSDEITLIIPSLKDITVDNRESKKHKIHKRIRDNWEHMFSGRVQKMSSLISSFTAIKFNKHLKDCLECEIASCEYASDEDRKYWAMIFNEKIGNAWFDCRVFGVDSDEETFNAVLGRIRDCEKNSRSMFAQAHCSHKELQKKSGLEQVEYCFKKTGLDWNSIDNRYKYGILVKKEIFLKDVENEHPKALKQNQVERTRAVSFCSHLTFSEDNVKMIMSQYK